MWKITALKLTTCVALLAWVIGMGVVASSLSPAQAQSRGSLYNMDSMLKQRHPFAAWLAADPTRVTPASTSLRQAAARAMPTIVADRGGNRKVSDLFSEFRIGVLVHDTGPF